MGSAGPYGHAPILAIDEEARETRTFVLDTRLDAEPGQFLMLWIPDLDEKPFCIADSDPLTLCVRRVGPLTDALFDHKPGDRLWFRGPFGTGFRLTGRHTLLVGGGYGSAPLGFLCRRARAVGVRTVLAVGARTVADLLVTRNARAHADELHRATEDGTAGTRGRVTVLAERLLQDAVFDQVFACGPNAMLDAVRDLAARYGVGAQLSYERYMRCGLGICGSCEQDGLLVCRDGPVLHVPKPSTADA